MKQAELQAEKKLTQQVLNGIYLGTLELAKPLWVAMELPTSSVLLQVCHPFVQTIIMEMLQLAMTAKESKAESGWSCGDFLVRLDLDQLAIRTDLKSTQRVAALIAYVFEAIMKLSELQAPRALRMNDFSRRVMAMDNRLYVSD